MLHRYRTTEGCYNIVIITRGRKFITYVVIDNGVKLKRSSIREEKYMKEVQYPKGIKHMIESFMDAGVRSGITKGAQKALESYNA